MNPTRTNSLESPGALTRRLIALTAGLLVMNAAALFDLGHRLGALKTSIKWQTAILGSLLVGLGLLGLLAWTRGARRVLIHRLDSRMHASGASSGWVGGALFLLLLPALPLLTMLLAVKAFEPLSMRIVAWWLLSLLGAILLLGVRGGSGALGRLAFSGVAMAVVFQAAGYLPAISTYPLSLGWSEASRYYNASLFFASRIYGEPAPLPVLHPTRYLLQSIPYLFGVLPLWVHRLWQVLLWIVVTLGTSDALARRIGVRTPLGRAALAGAVYLFFMQGPVYYHLLMAGWIVLAGASTHRPWRTVAAVVLASAWAGISRVNWMPVPAILAIVLYLLETPVARSRRRLSDYLAWPLTLGAAGGLAALAANLGYAAFSGNPTAEFQSSFTSNLLWYRLFPSATYSLGVLPGVLLASAAPLVLVAAWALWHRHSLHAIRWLGLGGGLAVLFAGGLVVSAKIGGGGNLHNLDAYLLLLAVVAVYLALGPVADEPEAALATRRAPPWVLGACVAVPVAFALAAGTPWPAPDWDHARTTVARVTRAVAQARQEGQPVLFISERHLIAFEGLDIPLEPEYEKVYLMEMAMSGNQAYLDHFYADLASHRFGLIVSDFLSTGLRGPESPFGEENDVWAERVAQPLLVHYELRDDLGGLWLMVPRQAP